MKSGRSGPTHTWTSGWGISKRSHKRRVRGDRALHRAEVEQPEHLGLLGGPIEENAIAASRGPPPSPVQAPGDFPGSGLATFEFAAPREPSAPVLVLTTRARASPLVERQAVTTCAPLSPGRIAMLTSSALELPGFTGGPRATHSRAQS
jgi:hypothetical protein